MLHTRRVSIIIRIIKTVLKGDAALSGFKKILSVILALMVILPGCGFYAFANERENTGEINLYGGFDLSNSVSTYSVADSLSQLDYVENKYGKAVEKIKKGIENFETEIQLSEFKMSATDLNNIMLYMNYYELSYYLDGMYSYYIANDNTINSVVLSYTMSKSDVAAANKIINSSINSVVSQAKKLKTDIEKIICVHDYLVCSIDYDSVNYDQTYNNMYGAFINKRTMCFGYSTAFNYIVRQLGIKSYIVTSAVNNHAWNLVYLDGNFYSVDCTWDDPVYNNPDLLSNPISEYCRYSNLMCSDSVMTAKGHEGSDWVANGVNVYGLSSSTVYDDFFWRSQSNKIEYSLGSWYAAVGKNTSSFMNAGFTVSQITFTDNSHYTINQIRDVNTAYMLSDYSGYTVYYPGLQSIGDSVYYRTSKGIFLLQPNETSDLQVFESTRSDNIYDFVIDANKHTFTVDYGLEYTSVGTVVTYNNADYICKVQGHQYGGNASCLACGDTKTVPPEEHVHTWNDGVKQADGSILYTCTTCGDTKTVPPEEHVHTWNSGVKQADGSILYTCTACGATKREKQMNFEDVTPDRYFYEPIKWAYDNDITVGTSPTRFSPDDACTRAQIVTFIWRAKGCPEPKTTKNPFTDVTPANYFYKAVLWAVENGITVGTSATLFSPNAPCTRAQAVTFIWRAENEPSSTVKNPFTDVTADRYFYAPVLWALENGITIGTKPTLFSPDATCTRAQIVTFLYRDVVQNA